MYQAGFLDRRLLIPAVQGSGHNSIGLGFENLTLQMCIWTENARRQASTSPAAPRPIATQEWPPSTSCPKLDRRKTIDMAYMCVCVCHPPDHWDPHYLCFRFKDPSARSAAYMDSPPTFCLFFSIDAMDEFSPFGIASGALFLSFHFSLDGKTSHL